jgi:hypothetical protein
MMALLMLLAYLTVGLAWCVSEIVKMKLRREGEEKCRSGG